MSNYDKEPPTIDAESIRDTNTFTGVKIDTGEFTAETIVVYNSLDQSVDIQLQGSIDGTTWIDIDTTFTITATTNEYETVSDFFPFYRCTAKCTISPTTGTVTVWVVKSKGA